MPKRLPLDIRISLLLRACTPEENEEISRRHDPGDIVGRGMPMEYLLVSAALRQYPEIVTVDREQEAGVLIGIGIGVLELGVILLLVLAVGISVRRLSLRLRSSGRVDWIAVGAIAVLAVVILGIVHLVRMQSRDLDEQQAQVAADQRADEATLAAIRNTPPDPFEQAKATMCTEEVRRLSGAQDLIDRIEGGVAHVNAAAVNVLNAETTPAFATWAGLCVANSRTIELSGPHGSLGSWSLDGGFSPGPALTAAPAPIPLTETVVASYSGKGQKKPQPFTVGDRWEVRWTARGAAFSMVLHTADGEYVDLLANELGASDSSAFVPKGGDYYLDIRGVGRWSVEVVQLP
jgi:PAS domain-containing protein